MPKTKLLRVIMVLFLSVSVFFTSCNFFREENGDDSGNEDSGKGDGYTEESDTVEETGTSDGGTEPPVRQDVEESVVIDGLHLKYVDGSYSVTDYDEEAHDDTEVIIPESYDGIPVTSIGDRAFASAEKLNLVEIPDGVVKIGSMAFFNCERLSVIRMPDSVIYVGQGAFERTE